jgi:hypothetical protein
MYTLVSLWYKTDVTYLLVEWFRVQTITFLERERCMTQIHVMHDRYPERYMSSKKNKWSCISLIALCPSTNYTISQRDFDWCVTRRGSDYQKSYHPLELKLFYLQWAEIDQSINAESDGTKCRTAITQAFPFAIVQWGNTYVSPNYVHANHSTSHAMPGAWVS